MSLNFNTICKWVRLGEGAKFITCDLIGQNAICKGTIRLGQKLRVIESEQHGMAINRNYLCAKCWQTYGQKVLETHKKLAKEMIERKGMADIFNKQMEQQEQQEEGATDVV